MTEPASIPTTGKRETAFGDTCSDGSASFFLSCCMGSKWPCEFSDDGYIFGLSLNSGFGTSLKISCFAHGHQKNRDLLLLSIATDTR